MAKGLAGEALIIAPDLRQHGFSTQEKDISYEQLVSDLDAIIPAILHRVAPEHTGKFNVVLIGHSLGGSLITGVSGAELNILCLVQIDITEQTALASLPNMQAILARKKMYYEGEHDFVQQMVRSRTLTTAKAARIELPGVVDGDFRVRTDLQKSSQYWAGWFRGMNARFIGHTAWKLLLVSTLEKLDRDHEIANMQGKIAIEVVPGCVHNLHEDNPEKVVHILQEYLRRLHYTQRLYDMPMDFKRGMTDDERPESMALIKQKVE